LREGDILKAYDDVMNFWKTGGAHQPEDYLMEYTKNRSRRLVEYITKLNVGKDAMILEIGCGCGRNLHYLYDVGFKNLTGIEIEGYSISVMEKNFPEMYKNIETIVFPIENVIEAFDDDKFDVVICMGILMHIHPDVFDKIASEIHRITKKNLLTFEAEQRGGLSPWCENRNYKEIFEGLGFEEIEEITEPIMRILFGSREYYGRIFKK